MGDIPTDKFVGSGTIAAAMGTYTGLLVSVNELVAGGCGLPTIDCGLLTTTSN